MLQLFVQKLRNTMFREIPKPLGRWSINKCDTSISVVNYYANVDHCGSCDYEKKMIDSMIDLDKTNQVVNKTK